MEKEFDDWNKEKKRIDAKRAFTYAHPREVWWCSLGINVGAEIDGKNRNYERPVLVMRVYNKETLLILPITSKEKDDHFHARINVRIGNVWVKLTQARVVSSRRLLRKVDTIAGKEFVKVQEVFRALT
ncbi:MAG: type II toxin-antitoxin system PemK/MazF family toxin [Minisyncoccia bacterium]